MIFPLPKGKWYKVIIFPLHKGKWYKVIIFPEGSGNIISSHKSLWKCHSHNKGFLMEKYPFILVWDFSFIVRMHFIFFLENLRTSLEKIYGHVPPGINGYFYIILFTLAMFLISASWAVKSPGYSVNSTTYSSFLFSSGWNAFTFAKNNIYFRIRFGLANAINDY